MSKADHPLQLFTEIANAIDKVGVKRTIAILKNGTNDSLTLVNPEVDFVIKMITSEFKLTIEELVTSNDRSFARKTAMMLTVYYLHSEPFKVIFDQIGSLMKRDPAQMYRYFKTMADLKKNKDKTYIKYFEKFDIIVSSYQIENTTSKK